MTEPFFHSKYRTSFAVSYAKAWRFVICPNVMASSVHVTGAHLEFSSPPVSLQTLGLAAEHRLLVLVDNETLSQRLPSSNSKVIYSRIYTNPHMHTDTPNNPLTHTKKMDHENIFKPFKDQMYAANGEYREVRVEAATLLEKLEKNQERLDALQRGTASEAFEGEKAALEDQKAWLVGLDRDVRDRMRRWLIIIEECINAMRQGAFLERESS